MKTLFTICLLICAISLSAQSPFFKKINHAKPTGKVIELGKVNDISKFINKGDSRQFPNLFQPNTIQFKVEGIKVDKIGNSIWVEGVPKNLGASIRHKFSLPFNYLDAIKSQLDIKDVEREFKIVDKMEDQIGMTHYKMQQMYQGLEVFSGEVILHQRDAEISHMNGILFSDINLESVQPQFDQNRSIDIAYEELGMNRAKAMENPYNKYLGNEDLSKLLIYEFKDKSYLAYHVELHASPTEYWAYFIDAHSGNVINKYSKICNFYGKALKEAGHNHNEGCTNHTIEPTQILTRKVGSIFDGPAVGTGIDLLGRQREVRSYEFNGTYLMMDASRQMFKSVGNESTAPQGVIYTIDAQHIAPKDDKLTLADITSTSANFNNPTAVSVHANAGEVYKYFRTIHSRRSYNNMDGNLLSFINFVEEDNTGFDNAFWGGTAMYYGNGNMAFRDLPAGLDVAAHEMGHGTIQTTAGLVYQDESGALNESFADVFGAMVDRDDWKIGDDIALPAAFPSGTMRDMEDPHNGGTSLNSRGYQPRIYSERYTGSEDNGGVHINSGIPNWAAFKIGSVLGKDKLEKIYYRALVNYLTRSSRFIDCRNAVIKSAEDIYGANSNEVQVAAQAFDQVGIAAGQSTNTQQDVQSNDGVQLVVYIDSDDGRINIATLDANDISEGLTNFNPISKPSVTDDGSFMVYVSDDNILRFVAFDWNSDPIGVQLGTIEENPQQIWRNVVVSKDGSKLAIITAEANNDILLFDYNTAGSKTFKLTNPTSQDGVFNENVLRADAMEFDFSGEFLMYDAESDLGAYTTWDVGFLNYWDNNTNDFADGQIFKLVEGLPENVAIGNPTFSKNSPYIIALDYVEVVEDPFFGSTPEYSVYGFNIETGDYAAIVGGGVRLGYPTYSPADDFLMYTSQSSDIVFDGIETLFAAPLNPNKISFADMGNILQFKQYGNQANWFAIGSRDFSTVSIKPNELLNNNVSLFPNPVSNNLKLNFELAELSNVQIQLVDLLGQVHYSNNDKLPSGKREVFVEMENLSSGVYFIKLDIDGKRGSYKVVKE